MSETTAEIALDRAQKAHQAALREVYLHQVKTYQKQAERALSSVILPWWNTFEHSEQAARIGLLMRQKGFSKPQISDRVRYFREDGREWEAYISIGGEARQLKLVVNQLRDGKEPGSWAGAMFAHTQLRNIPDNVPKLKRLDLHPIVLIDFAEQIETHVVSARIHALLERSGR